MVYCFLGYFYLKSEDVHDYTDSPTNLNAKLLIPYYTYTYTCACGKESFSYNSIKDDASIETTCPEGHAKVQISVVYQYSFERYVSFRCLTCGQELNYHQGASSSGETIREYASSAATSYGCIAAINDFEFDVEDGTGSSSNWDVEVSGSGTGANPLRYTLTYNGKDKGLEDSLAKAYSDLHALFGNEW